jgi:hypothetical protein
MVFTDLLQKMLKVEKHPVNRMYLNEILMKWRKVERAAEEFQKGAEPLENYLSALSEYTRDLQNAKYRVNKQSKTGFKSNSEIFALTYIDDLLTLFINKYEICRQPGVTWGYQRFSGNIRFYQKCLFLNRKQPDLEIEESPKFLQLTQQIDLQYRLAGKRTFSKHTLTVPIIVFHTYRTFLEEQFIRVEYYAKLARETFGKVKNVVVTESIEPNFFPDLDRSCVDAIFVLRKQAREEPLNDIAPDVVRLLEIKIREYLHECEHDPREIVRKGFID